MHARFFYSASTISGATWTTLTSHFRKTIIENRSKWRVNQSAWRKNNVNFK